MTAPLTGIIDWHNHWISPSGIRLLGARTDGAANLPVPHPFVV